MQFNNSLIFAVFLGVDNFSISLNAPAVIRFIQEPSSTKETGMNNFVNKDIMLVLEILNYFWNFGPCLLYA
jgi:hypothetical protein